MHTTASVTYQVGGSLPGTASTYVHRQADDALWDGLMAGEFCYVLNARQMGKSSLRVQVMQRLQGAGVACAAVDITKIGSQNINTDQWYASLIGALVQGLNLNDFPLRAWWRERQHLAPVQRLGEFIETVLLKTITTPIVIFIDEIDSLLSLPFDTDDFFTWMRACYNERVDNPDFNRLTFAFLGVTTPANLIQDKQRTPFNIGRAIPLDGLALPAAAPLAQGLAHLSDQPEFLLQAILDWTGGQPFLTQKLCRLAQQHLQAPIAPGQEAATIAQLVQAKVLTDWEHYDEPEHLKTIRNRLLANEHRAGRLLGLYQHLLQAGTIPADDSSEQIDLRLTGLVAYDQGQLRVFNPIYAHVFDLAWVEHQLGQLRPYGGLLQAWVESGGQDTSRLLRGESLKEALAWASDKSLSDQDHQFLAASQDWQQQETQRTLLIERQEKEAIAAANQILSQASQKAQRLVQIAGIGLGIVSVIAALVGTGLVRTSQELQASQTSLLLEQNSITILSQFPEQPLASLVAAVENGRKLLQLVGDAPLADYPTTRPILTLNMILADILARNQWQATETIVGSSILADGQILTVTRNGTLQFWNSQGQRQRQQPLTIPTLDTMRADPRTNRLALFTTSGTGFIRPLEGNSGGIIPLAALNTPLASFKFSPTGQGMAGLDNNGQVYLWENGGALQAQFAAQVGNGSSLAYAPDGQTLVTTGNNGLVRLWTTQGTLLKTWRAGAKPSTITKSLVFLNANAIAGVGDDGMLRIWTPQGEQINQWRISVTPAYFVGVSPNGQVILTLSEDNIIRLWNYNGLLIDELSGHERFVSHVEFNALTQFLVSSDRSGQIFLWDLARRNPAWDAEQASLWNVVFHPKGTTLATAGKDGSIKLWRTNGQLQRRLQASQTGINTLAFSHRGDILVFGSEAGDVGLWHLPSNQTRRLQAPGSAIYTVAMSPADHYIAAAGATGTITLWGQNLDQPTAPPFSPTAPLPAPTTIKAHSGAIWSMAFLPQARDNPVLVTTGQDGWIRLWQVRTGKLLQEINPKQGWLTSLRLSADGQTIIVAGEGGLISLWEQNGQRIRQFKGHMSSILSLGLSQDGQMIASVAQDGIVNVWAPSGQLLASLADHRGTTYSLDISPVVAGTPQTLAIVGQDDTVHLVPLLSLPQLLARSCDWLQDYQVTHPTAQQACPAPPSPQ